MNPHPHHHPVAGDGDPAASEHESITELRELLMRLGPSTADPLFLCDASGQILHVNSAGARLAELSIAQLAGTPIQRFESSAAPSIAGSPRRQAPSWQTANWSAFIRPNGVGIAIHMDSHPIDWDGRRLWCIRMLDPASQRGTGSAEGLAWHEPASRRTKPPGWLSKARQRLRDLLGGLGSAPASRAGAADGNQPRQHAAGCGRSAGACDPSPPVPTDQGRAMPDRTVGECTPSPRPGGRQPAARAIGRASAGADYPICGPTDQAAAGARVLVVDDNRVNRTLLERWLQMAGMQVHSVEDGMAAVNCVSQTTFDVILMDVSMPGMNGLEATRAIRALGQGTADQDYFEKLPIIGVSAHAMKGDREHYMASGMNEYITKPIQRVALLGTITASMRLTQRHTGQAACFGELD